MTRRSPSERSRASNDRGEDGLSTLEALVAIAIMAIALLPLIELQTRITRTHERYRTLYEQATLGRNALALLRDVNPMAQDSGRLEIDDDYLLVWSAVQESEPVRSADYPNGDGEFEVAMYRLDVRILGPQGESYREALRRVGWRRIGAAGAASPLPLRPDEIVPP